MRNRKRHDLESNKGIRTGKKRGPFCFTMRSKETIIFKGFSRSIIQNECPCLKLTSCRKLKQVSSINHIN